MANGPRPAGANILGSLIYMILISISRTRTDRAGRSCPQSKTTKEMEEDPETERSEARKRGQIKEARMLCLLNA